MTMAEESLLDTSSNPETSSTVSGGYNSGISREGSLGSAGSEGAGAALDDDSDGIPWASGISVEKVKCECCGLTEECTPVYIKRVRDVHSGLFVCGLCAEAVKEERRRKSRSGGGGGGALPIEEALKSHLSICVQFNSPERANPATQLASAMDTMRHILMRRIHTGSPDHEHKPKSRHSRSTSCIPVIRHSMQSTDDKPSQ